MTRSAKATRRFRREPLLLSPLSFFLVWFAALLLLTDASWGLQAKGWLFVLGLLVPAFLFYRLEGPVAKGPKAPTFPSPPAWLWAALAGLALFLRFWKLTSLFVWPNGDEGLCGAIIFQLHSHWDWRFFHSYGQAPPLFYWWGLLILELTRSPFLSLWLGPALVSVLTLPLMFLFLKAWWDDATAWIGTGLAAFSFWPLLIGRVNCQGDLLPAWECLLLFLLARHSTLPPARRPGAGFLLGLAAGLGFLTLTPWVAVTAWIVLLFFGLPFSRPRPARETAFFFGGLGLGLLAFSAVAFPAGFGRHVSHLWAESGSGGAGRFLWVGLDYLAAVFTGTDHPGAAYSPTGGGFLNPLLGAGFILGSFVLWKSPRKIDRGILAGLLLAFLPGALSGSLETFRIIGLLPLLLAVSARGILHLLALAPGKSRLPLLAALLMVTAVWDFSRLTAPYQGFEQDPQQLRQTDRSYESWKAFQILRDLDKKWGPGLALTDFPAGFPDETLGFATFPFNKAWNDSIPEDQLRWAALFTHSSYQPFLSARFPAMRWWALDPGPHPAWVLGVLPWGDPGAKTLWDWNGTHRFFMDLNDQTLEIPHGSSRQTVLDRMLRVQSRLPPDPFLQSCFWEKAVFLESWDLAFYPPDPSEAHALFARAFDQWGLRGYRTSLFWYKKGLWLLSEDQRPAARGCFQQALRLDPFLAAPGSGGAANSPSDMDPH